jgi:phage repressor protein C with HTH and peptisase S24 domain
MENKDKKRSALGERIESRLLEIGKNQPWLAKEIGVGQSAISHIVSGATKRPKSSPEIAKALKVNLEWLLNGTGPKETANATEGTDNTRSGKSGQSANTAFPTNMHDLVPLYGAANAAHPSVTRLAEDFKMGDEPRHPAIYNVKGGFAMLVYGESMAPRHRPGEKVYVHPYLFPTIGQDCIVVEEPEGNAFIKEFRGENADEWRFIQLNPPKDIRIKKSKVRKIYAVVR